MKRTQAQALPDCIAIWEIIFATLNLKLTIILNKCDCFSTCSRIFNAKINTHSNIFGHKVLYSIDHRKFFTLPHLGNHYVITWRSMSDSTTVYTMFLLEQQPQLKKTHTKNANKEHRRFDHRIRSIVFMSLTTKQLQYLSIIQA